MEIREHKTSKLEELSKDSKLLEGQDLDKSLGKPYVESSSFEKSDEISFGGNEQTERDLASSELQNELSSCGIYVRGQIYSDKTWGGLNYYSGELVHDKINAARNADHITDEKYKNLMALLKKACYYQ